MDIGRGRAIEALRSLRAVRRRRFVEQLNVMEALYRVYVVAIFGGLGLALLAGAISDPTVGGAALGRLAERGPAILGVAVSLAVLAGLRSGSRGGPLAIEAAEVQHVLLAPVPRAAALRPAAIRQLRVAALTGSVVGLAVAAFAVPRLPGSSVEWFAVLAAFGALLPLCYLGPALLACGRGLGPRLAGVLGLLLLAWSIADLALGWKSCPATMLGSLATLPLQSGVAAVLGFAGAALALLVLAAAMALLGGLSLDLARRRSTLAAQLRFSASVQDLRTVVLLRRQLASERPRPRPWLRATALARLRAPVERRALRSFLRWPAARVARVLAAGVLAGLIAAAVWSGTTPLVALIGAPLFVAALDVVEPLAQEVDHPTRRDLLPVDPGSLIVRHLRAPTLAMALVTAAGVFTALAFGATAGEVAAGILALAPTALLLVSCAALSATNDPYRFVLNPQLGYLQSGAPIVVSLIAAGVPVLLARETVRHGHSALAAVIPVEVVLLMIAAGLASFVGSRVAKSARAVA